VLDIVVDLAEHCSGSAFRAEGIEESRGAHGQGRIEKYSRTLIHATFSDGVEAGSWMTRWTVARDML